MEIETLEMMKEGSRTLSAFQKPWILAHIVFIQIEHVDQNSISSCPNRHIQHRRAARSRSRME